MRVGKHGSSRVDAGSEALSGDAGANLTEGCSLAFGQERPAVSTQPKSCSSSEVASVQPRGSGGRVLNLPYPDPGQAGKPRARRPLSSTCFEGTASRKYRGRTPASRARPWPVTRSGNARARSAKPTRASGCRPFVDVQPARSQEGQSLRAR